MKEALGYFIAGVVLMLWVNAQWCTPGPHGGSLDTLAHTSDTLFLIGHDTTIIKEFHYSKETTMQIPQLSDSGKDSVIRDYYTLRMFDTVLYQELNYRMRIRMSLSQNHLQEMFTDFENLRPTAINNTTVLECPPKLRFFIGGSARADPKFQVVPMISLQLKSLDQIIGGYNLNSKTIELGALWHPRLN